MKHPLSPRLGLYIGGLGLAAAAACSSSNNVVMMMDAGHGSEGGSGSSGGSTSSGGTGSSSGSSSGSGSNSSSGSTSSSGSGSSGSKSDGGSSGTDGGGSSSSSGGTDGGGEGGSGNTAIWGTKVTVTVGWPTTGAISSGTGDLSVWFLEVHNIGSDGMSYTGTTRSCKTITPDIMTIVGKVSIQIADSVFDKVNRTFPISGVEGTPGGASMQNATLGGLGIVDGSPYLTLPNPQTWPPDCDSSSSMTCNTTGSFTMADLVDDDMHGGYGVTATFPNTNGYTYPPTDLLATNSADIAYVVLRQEVSASGMLSSDGMSASGTATLLTFDNHVVACHVAGGSACDNTQASFVDSQRTKYTTAAGSMQSNAPPISPTNPVMGTYTSKKLSAGATCADVRTALP